MKQNVLPEIHPELFKAIFRQQMSDLTCIADVVRELLAGLDIELGSFHGTGSVDVFTSGATFYFETTEADQQRLADTVGQVAKNLNGSFTLPEGIQRMDTSCCDITTWRVVLRGNRTIKERPPVASIPRPKKGVAGFVDTN